MTDDTMELLKTEAQKYDDLADNKEKLLDRLHRDKREAVIADVMVLRVMAAQCRATAGVMRNDQHR